MLAPTLLAAVDAAVARRHDLMQRLNQDGTDCYRVFHGVVEGEPGLTIDRYGPLLLLQTFRAPLSHDDAEELGRHTNRALGLDLHVACNHRLGSGRFGDHHPSEKALAEHLCMEDGIAFCVQARHRGQDPWLFLDLRAGRRVLRRLARHKTVLNLFAYTCGAGVAAAKGGALEVLNVDFAETALEVGRRNAKQNGVPDACFRTLSSDCIPVLRQLAGKPVQRRGKSFRFPKVEPRPFDVVFLDPPRWSKGPFGAVDVVRDYASLWKPCVQTLADEGVAIATNHVAEVTPEAFVQQLRRTAEKAGRPLREVELVAPDGDFPSFDGNPPLKIAVCRL